MGARGNSVVILSQLWRGFSRGVLHGRDVLDAGTFVKAFAEARYTAYKGVVRPVEGTILTVARGVAEATAAVLPSTNDPITILEVAVKAADEWCQKTPEMLPVLKQAGVVDSGGKGLFFIIEGMLRHVYGESLDTPLASMQALSAMNLENAMQEVEEGQDYEVVVDFFPNSGFELQSFYGKLETMGTSTQLITQKPLTFNPAKGRLQLQAVLLEIAPETGHTVAIERICQALPDLGGVGRVCNHTSPGLTSVVRHR